VIEMIESRAEHYASVCPMMFFYGLPGVLGRMVAEVDLTVTYDDAIDEHMAFPSIDDAVNAAVPLRRRSLVAARAARRVSFPCQFGRRG
jgi:hypothetical protein